ncbi:MAG: anthranilate phosphoribosyltransferase [Thermodesulfobacteriota bacterium]|jgi:anthranilate phosphoribosyltransferase|nr:MAG: anthranilate phosphoribosyltransferase [Thermodesulfobacteriota bacterium]
MIKEAIEKAIILQNFSEQEMSEIMEEIMEGKATPAQIGALLTALRIKGEAIAELTGAARAMRRHAIFIDAASNNILDTCGTGGDKSNTFNISTTVAFVAAGGGLTVAKHGNRSVSSKCGSADLLEELGVNIQADPEILEQCIREIGIGFLFAPKLHGAMKYAGQVRREIGIRTIFNMLGPLTNPAGATCQVLGVYAAGLTEMFASVLKNLGTKKALVVHGADGLDEITLRGETRVTELSAGQIKTYNLNPRTFFDKTYSPDDFRGGDPKENARITKAILAGEKGAPRDIVLINAAAALLAGETVSNLTQGIKRAEEIIDSGEAAKKLKQLIELSND